MEDYQAGDIIYILMKKSSVESVVNEWAEGNWECDLKVRRSQKNKGHVVIETTDVFWANRIMRWYAYEKVTYKHPITK